MLKIRLVRGPDASAHWHAEAVPELVGSPGSPPTVPEPVAPSCARRRRSVSRVLVLPVAAAVAFAGSLPPGSAVESTPVAAAGKPVILALAGLGLRLESGAPPPRRWLGVGAELPGPAALPDLSAPAHAGPAPMANGADAALLSPLPGRTDESTGIPVTVLEAYRRAERNLAQSDPSCRLPWWLLAGIGRIESGHASGGRVDAAGATRGRILGVRLDGSVPGTAVIRDTDAGRYDGDPAYDRAVGPMQFLPGTWRAWARDGNGDGVADPNNIFDAATAAGAYLCASGGDLSIGANLARAVLAYNYSTSYLVSVLSWGALYRAGVTPGPDAGGLVLAGTARQPEPVAAAALVPAPPSARPSAPTSTLQAMPVEPAPSVANRPVESTTPAPVTPTQPPALAAPAPSSSTVGSAGTVPPPPPTSQPSATAAPVPTSIRPSEASSCLITTVPTTTVPTTTVPPTTVPTTAVPTTSMPPTSMPPTTAVPTTTVPTTSMPPTTAVPTTGCPAAVAVPPTATPMPTPTPTG